MLDTVSTPGMADPVSTDSVSPPQPVCAIIRRPCTTGTSVGAWRSLVARIVRDDEVGGSNPLAPTRMTKRAHERVRAERIRPPIPFRFGARVHDEVEPHRLDIVECRSG